MPSDAMRQGEAGRRPKPRARGPVARRTAACGLLLLAAPVVAWPQTTREEALAAVYPGAAVRAERIFLTAEQQKAATALAGTEIGSALWARYVAVRDGAEVGRAYVDTHVVRTKKESLLVSLDADGRVRRIDVIAFLEPPEYQTPAAWLGQYRGRALNDELHLQRAIRPIAGATLSAKAVTLATRRVLAIDRVLADSRSKEAQ